MRYVSIEDYFELYFSNSDELKPNDINYIMSFRFYKPYSLLKVDRSNIIMSTEVILTQISDRYMQ